MADVDRRFRGRWVLVRFGDVDAGIDIGGERGLSGLSVPLLCADGGLELLGGGRGSLCVRDWERERSAKSEAFFLLS
jgi:hypothetical protein